MLGASLTHEDTRAFLSSTFIGAPLDCGLAMLAPMLYLWNAELRTFKSVLASDMALRPGQHADLCSFNGLTWTSCRQLSRCEGSRFRNDVGALETS